ncbi:MAG: phosphoribosyltransferase [Acidobacteriota bacterium]|nr:phosphoribosyltransferase [Acidobacteriota bacterium]
MVFANRRIAGQALAKLLAEESGIEDALVLGLPRGGVPVAYEIASACSLQLDILVVRKLGAPRAQELAMGAIASTGDVVWNTDVLAYLHVSRQEMHQVLERERAELKRKENIFREGQPPLPLAGRISILVDDGLATGATMRVAIQAVRTQTKSVIVAVPVGARTACDELESKDVRVHCLVKTDSFGAVGEFYQDFSQTTDDEVRHLLTKAREEYRLRYARKETGPYAAQSRKSSN